MVSHWSLSYSESPQISRTLLSILANLNNAVFLMASTRPVISKSSSSCTKPLVTILRTRITIGIIVHVPLFFFNSLARSRYLSFFSLSLNFTQRSTGTVKSTICQVRLALILYYIFFLLSRLLFVQSYNEPICYFSFNFGLFFCNVKIYVVCSHNFYILCS